MYKLYYTHRQKADCDISEYTLHGRYDNKITLMKNMRFLENLGYPTKATVHGVEIEVNHDD